MFELWRKGRELHKIRKSYDAEIKKARKENKSSEEIDELVYGLMADTDFVEEEINTLLTNQLVEKAKRLFLPVPPLSDDDMWEKGDLTGLWYLRRSGIAKLLGLIREERAARRKAVLEWVTPLTGIIGVTTGLLAVILTMT